MNLLKHKAVRNAGWIAGGRLASKALAFAVSILAARYLGPEHYGLVNYAAAYTTLFAALCTLGLPQVMVRELTRDPGGAGETVGSAVVLRLISALLSVVMIVGLALLTDGDDPLAVWVVGLCSLSLPLQAFDALAGWFQVGLKSRFAVAAALTGYAVGSVYKLLLLAGGRSVVWFALTGAADHLAAAGFLLLAYRRCGGPKLRFSRRRGRELLRRGRGFLLSGLMVSVYAATDRMMLRHLLGEGPVGQYATALSLSVVWTFLLTAVIDSAAPGLTELYDRDRPAFFRNTRRLYAGIFWGAAAVALALTVGARPLVTLLYGTAYAPAAEILRPLAWCVGFSYLGVARNIWVACEDRQRWLLPLYAAGAALNVGLNALLIPQFGGAGAAWASLATQAAVTFLIPALIPALRPNAALMTEAAMLRGVLPKRNRSDKP